MAKITPESFTPESEEQRKQIWQVIGFGENSSESKSKTYIEFFKKLILDNSSPAPNSPSGEQKPQVNKSPEQILYDQYLKDTADFNFPETSENPKNVNAPPLSPLDFVEQHQCHYRATVKEKDGSFSIYCDTKKIPLEVCVTRQKRFLFMKKNCKPIGYKPPQKQWQQHTQQEPKTRPYKGDTEGYYDPFSIGDGYQ